MTLHISPSAQSDLQGIKDYITVELENPTAALNTIARIIQAIRKLPDFPDSGSPLSSVIGMPTYYRFLVSGSYLIFYRHEGDNVYIVRVLYGARDYTKILFGELREEEN